MAGLAGVSLSIGGFGAASLAFVVAALTMVTLMFTLATGIASAGERVGETMRTSAPTVKRWGGRILIVVGAWFLILAAFAGFFANVFRI